MPPGQLPDRVATALQRVNDIRQGRIRTESARDLAGLEDYFCREFRSHQKLAVYGSLAPGRSNHHEMTPMRGRWFADLAVHGDYLDVGWGAQMGFPAMRSRADGEPIPVHLFLSRQLPQHWQRLDEFEGEEYCRILIPVFCRDRFVTVANLYEAADSRPSH